MERKEIAQKQMQKLLRREQRLLQKERGSSGGRLTAAAEGKIPDKAVETCQAAFEKGFQMVFSKGAGWIEKSCSPEKLRQEYEINRFALSQDFSARSLKRFDRQAQSQARQSKGLAALEGGALGLLGIGLPDIPVFLGVLLRAVYQAAISYGFDCRQEGERVFILSILNTALTEGEERRELSARTDFIGWQLDTGHPLCSDIDREIRATSNRLAARLLTAKFVQGLPVVGVVGAAVNYNLVKKVSRVSMLKYKKRFLDKAAGRRFFEKGENL